MQYLLPDFWLKLLIQWQNAFGTLYILLQFSFKVFTTYKYCPHVLPNELSRKRTISTVNK